MYYFIKALSKVKMIIALCLLTTTVAGSVSAVNIRTTHNAPMYYKANKSSQQLTIVSKGVARKVLGQTTYYYKIKFNGKIGYISKKKAELDIEIWVRATKNASMYSEPNKNSDIVAILEQGSVEKVLETTTNYYKVEFGGQAGYVAKKNVEITDKKENENPTPDIANKIAETAEEQIGKPYVYGGVGPNSFDASGFCQYVFKVNGISIPRSTSLQYNAAKSLQIGNTKITDVDDLQAGDFIFFSNDTALNNASYGGIYIGNGEFVYCGSSKIGVAKVSMSNYYKARFLLAIRF